MFDLRKMENDTFLLFIDHWILCNSHSKNLIDKCFSRFFETNFCLVKKIFILQNYRSRNFCNTTWHRIQCKICLSKIGSNKWVLNVHVSLIKCEESFFEKSKKGKQDLPKSVLEYRPIFMLL